MKRRSNLALGIVVAVCGALDAVAASTIALAPATIRTCGPGWVLTGTAMLVVYTLGWPLFVGAFTSLALAQLVSPLRRYDIWIGSVVLFSVIAWITIAGYSANFPVPSNPANCTMP